MSGLQMTFRINRDRGIAHQVTHIKSTNQQGIILFVSEINKDNKKEKSKVIISSSEFKRNNPELYDELLRMKENNGYL